MEDFFETPVNLQQSFPFLHHEPPLHRDQKSIIQDLEKNWQYCLQLKEKETGNFSFMTVSTDNHPVLFRFDAVGINSPVYNEKSQVLFAVKKIRPNKNLSTGSKTRDNYQKDYAEFIEIAAHDLDAPLRKISLLVDRLNNKSMPGANSELQGYYNRIQSSLGEMRALIDNLSTWATLPPPAPGNTGCNAVQVINETVAELRYRNPEKKIDVSIPDLPMLEGDPGQYRLLFQQLLKNAVTYSKQNEPVVINISAEPLKENEYRELHVQRDKEFTKISIADQGIGFDQQYAEKVFRPFTRLHGKSEYPGTGMGLAICKKIVENQGGIIYAESKEKNGATFTLILPQCH